MRTTETRTPKQSEDQNGPFRPLFVESEEMKVRYELDEEEVREAVIEWLENHHEIRGTSSGNMVFTEMGQHGTTINTSLLNKYNLAIDIEGV